MRPAKYVWMCFCTIEAEIEILFLSVPFNVVESENEI